MTADNPEKAPSLPNNDDASSSNADSAPDAADLVSVTAEASTIDLSSLTADQLADDDMLAAVTAISPEHIANLEHAVDQLIGTTDLFDVPSFDFDGVGDA